jgi:tricorn protease
MKKIMLAIVAYCIAAAGFAQTNPLWMRYPAISPDGQTIVFSYKGDLYKVPAAGGAATILTTHEAHDYMPVWSHDGKSIAFASDRYGNFDVFIMPASGGEPTRLTYHSAHDYPWDFSTDDKQVVFGTVRNDVSSSVRFPNKNVFLKLYSVPATGGRSILVSNAGFGNAHYNSKGTQLIFEDKKGGEDAWRKHHTSSVTRDIWLYDVNSKEYQKISSFEGEDREPVFSGDDQSVYYLSEKNGTQNIFKIALGNKAAEKQVTSFKDHPVRHLSRSNNNTLCFTWNGDIYTAGDKSEPRKVAITINADSRSNADKIVSISSGVTGFNVSPNGKEIAFVFRGEVFVASVEGGITKRITNTPQQERNIQFSPDGRSLYYSTERNDSWDIMRASITRKEEPYFYASTVLSEEPLIATEKEEFQPQVSPDGKEIAYLEERNILRVYNIEKKTSRTIIPAGQNFSYSDGDQSYSWGPDSKWIAARSSMGRYGAQNIVLFKTDEPDPKGINITRSGFSNNTQQWAFGGKAIIWSSDKDGKKPLAYQGAREMDVYAVFFDKDVYDRFRLSKDDYGLVKEKEDKEKKDTTKKKEPFVPDFSELATRKVRLTNGSLNLGSFNLSPNGDKLYFTAGFEQGFDVWVVDTRTRELKSLTKLGANLALIELSKDGKTLYYFADGRLGKIDAETGRTSPININTEMVLNTAGERAYIFEHAWRQAKKKFYDTKLHGADWNLYHKTYARFLPHINNNYDFQELLSEMLGELNGSHTGGRYSPQSVNPDVTASMGMLFDETTNTPGLRIMEVIAGGPVDKAKFKIIPGQIVEKIDGETIGIDKDWSIYLNRKAGKNVLISLFDPATSTRWDEVIKPISSGEENTLLYNRWVKTMEEMVTKLSGGKVGYVHVQSMNDGTYRNIYEDVLGKHADKEALIVDTRFNGGGWLHEDLSNFLSGKQYIRFEPYGFAPEGGEPQGKWYKPSCVLICEANYSDAHTFPYAYRAKQIGKLIGMPVPGTSTSVWWETQIDPTLIFGIPMVGNIGVKENRPLENFQIEPDIKIANEYKYILTGKDQQIEAAVKEMLATIKK